jgi:hypothetical protein
MRRVVGLLALVFLASAVPVLLVPAVAVTADEPAFAASTTIARTHVGADGVDEPVTQSTFSVTADRTTELRGRERVHVSWSGAIPSGGRTADPHGEHGLTQEYPVVILQCRGVDSTSVPLDQQLRPETCWTTTSMQRSAVVVHRTAVWRHDRYETEAGRAARSGLDPFPEAECEVPSESLFSARITPFIAADGTQFLACDAAHMPPEAAVGASFPPAEIAAFTNGDGVGEADFEVRSAVENESLGCSRTVACSLVVIPIVGISCVSDDAECRRRGDFLPGSTNFESAEPHPAVSPRFWWSGSNWRNRVTIPLQFGLPPDACEVLDPRPPVGFYGSELVAQAALQWAPAYCLNKKRFKFQHNRMPDDAGFSLMSAGGAVAAFVSGPQKRRNDDPVGYAPTAVTGFGIGYVIDRPDNAGQFENLRLNPRLLAKLLTQSYPASALGLGHEGLESNPLTLNLDPEFQKLNPGLDTKDREAAATVLSLSNSSDVIESLTGYIASDSAAMDFIKGKPDQWGMKVNPTYRGIKVPRREWPLLDRYKPEALPGTCRYANNSVPYLSQVAAPVTSLKFIAEALIDAWPNVQTTCEGPLAGGLYKTGRVERQPFGSRFMLGVVSLGDAARFGLATAALETKRNTYVSASDATLAKAVALSEQKKEYGPFLMDPKEVRADGKAYPGTMIVYTAARTRGMEKKDAKTVASFIRISSTEGQELGRGNGELPSGYLPIGSKGVTGKLLTSAREVAKAVEAQLDAPAPEVEPEPTPQPEDNAGAGGGSGPPVPTGDVPTPPGDGAEPEAVEPTPTPSAAPTETPDATVVMPATAGVEWQPGSRLVPTLIIVGLGALLAAGALRFLGRLPR